MNRLAFRSSNQVVGEFIGNVACLFKSTNIFGVVVVINILLLHFDLNAAIANIIAVSMHNRMAPILPCKYSVRDVAFVGVHQTSWQLQLIKPKHVSDANFDSWNTILRSELDNSNVGWIWLNAESDEAERLTDRTSTTHLPGPDPRIFVESNDLKYELTKEADFADRIRSLIQSKARTDILSKIVEHLCVVVVFDSADLESNRHTNRIVDSAISQLEKQLWSLEKSVDKGAVSVIVPHQEIENEAWLLNSLGISTKQLPAVAILFGQGRRLGEVFYGEEIEAEKLLNRMQICGQDCECSLDRNWLYGTQLIHKWGKSFERAVESNLTFDPKSSFVIAEVSQILQKQVADQSESIVNLGGGLVIHDLDENRPDSSSTSGDPENISSESDSMIFENKKEPKTSSEFRLPAVVPVPLMVALIIGLIIFTSVVCLARRNA